MALVVMILIAMKALVGKALVEKALVAIARPDSLHRSSRYLSGTRTSLSAFRTAEQNYIAQALESVIEASHPRDLILVNRSIDAGTRLDLAQGHPIDRHENSPTAVAPRTKSA